MIPAFRGLGLAGLLLAAASGVISTSNYNAVLLVLALGSASALVVVALLVEPSNRTWVSLTSLGTGMVYFVAGAILLRTLPQADSQAYFDAAVLLRQDPDAAGQLGALADGKQGYSILLSLIFALGNPTILVGVAVSAVAMALVVPIAYSTARALRGERVGRIAAALVMLSPPLVLWGSQPLRESLVFLAVALIAWAGTNAFSTGRRRWLLALWIPSVPLLLIRGPLAVALPLGTTIGVLFAGRAQGNRGRVVMLSTLMMAGLVAISGSLVSLEALADRYGQEGLELSRTELALAATGFGAGAGLSGSGFFDGLARTMVGPFPWEWSSLPAYFALDALYWLALVSVVAIGLRALGRPAWILLGPALVVVAAVAISATNYGTLIRLRAQAIPVLLPLAAIGVAWLLKSERRRASAGVGAEFAAEENSARSGNG